MLHQCRGFIHSWFWSFWVFLPSLPLQARDLGLVEVFECFFLHSPCEQEICFSHTPYATIAGTGYYCAFRDSGSFEYTWVPDENLSTGGTKAGQRTTDRPFRWLQNRNRTWVPVWQIQYQLKDRQWLDCYRTVKKVDNGAPPNQTWSNRGWLRRNKDNVVGNHSAQRKRVKIPKLYWTGEESEREQRGYWTRR